MKDKRASQGGIVRCPKCNAEVLRVERHVTGYSDPHFGCRKCKYHGKLNWRREKHA